MPRSGTPSIAPAAPPPDRKTTAPVRTAFARALIAWHEKHGRHDLPWQNTRDPYRVWLSEIMLQQTQVSTVIGYYARFLDRFGSVQALAAARLEDVLGLWAGLGYYARARMAHRCAQSVVAAGGRFPDNALALAQLPGIGPSTAAAIAAFCFDEQAAILDANVKRVLARRHAIDGDPRRPAVVEQMWEQARALLPAPRDMARYTQAIMDLGATLCTRSRPRCDACPVAADCQARLTGRTAELPARAKAVARPLRTAHLLVVVKGRAVLLEQRPPRGIWGGLLSLPEFTSLRELQAGALALGGKDPAPLPGRRHGFTHFTLDFTPHLLQLPGRRRAPAGTGAAAFAAADAAARLRWLPLEDIDAAALPAPILSLLRDVRGTL